MGRIRQSNFIDIALLAPGIVIIILQLSIGSDAIGLQICSITNISVEYFDRDIKSKKHMTKTVRSSEMFQKAVSEWSLEIGIEIGIKGMGFAMNTAFSQMNSKELRTSNYESTEELSEIVYAPESRQLIRETEKSLTFRKISGSDTAETTATVTDEKHVGSVDKNDCPDRDINFLFKRAVAYINNTFGHVVNGQIRGRTYSHVKCFNSESRFVCPRTEDAEFGTTCMDYDENKYPFLKYNMDGKKDYLFDDGTTYPSNPDRDLSTPRFTQVAVNSTIRSCAAECTAHTADVLAPGCCEFHQKSRTCHWGRGNMIRKTKTANKNEIRAAICYKGVKCGGKRKANMCSMCPKDASKPSIPNISTWCKGDCKYNKDWDICYLKELNVAGVDGKFWSGMTECPKGSFISGFRTKKFGDTTPKGETTSMK